MTNMQLEYKKNIAQSLSFFTTRTMGQEAQCPSIH